MLRVIITKIARAECFVSFECGREANPPEVLGGVGVLEFGLGLYQRNLAAMCNVFSRRSLPHLPNFSIKEPRNVLSPYEQPHELAFDGIRAITDGIRAITDLHRGLGKPG